MWALFVSLCLYQHNSDLRDSHEYLQKQVWGAQNCTRQSSRRFGLERTRLTEASITVCFDSEHPTYLETLCVLSYAAQIWVVGISGEIIFAGVNVMCDGDYCWSGQWTAPSWATIHVTPINIPLEYPCQSHSSPSPSSGSSRVAVFMIIALPQLLVTSWLMRAQHIWHQSLTQLHKTGLMWEKQVRSPSNSSSCQKTSKFWP